MSIILQAEKLYKEYKTSSGAVNALNGVDLSIEKGLFYAIIGRSGSGKSTLLHVLSGLDRPTSGKVLIDGVDMFSFSDEKMAIFRRRSMGFVFQQFNLLDEYSVLNNICMPLRLDGRKPDETFLAEVTKMLGIEEKLKKYPYELSGGEQQRVAIARALAKNPKLMLCDEPTGALDYNTGKAVLQLLQDCSRKNGMTVVIITHNQALTAMADRVISVKSGTVTNISINPDPTPIENIEW